MREQYKIKVITSSLFLLSALNLAWQFYLIFERDREIRESSFDAPCDFGAWVLDKQIRIVLLLITFTMFSGSMLKGLWGKFLYLFSLTCGIFVYLFWWKESLAKVQALGLEGFIFPRMAYLGHGNYLDVSIAFVLIGLFLFEIISFINQSLRTKLLDKPNSF